MSVGPYIVQLRRQKGWTQAQLARQTGVSASTIAMYETNRRTPDPIVLDKLAQVLGVPPSRFAPSSAQAALTAEHPAAGNADDSPPASLAAEGGGVAHNRARDAAESVQAAAGAQLTTLALTPQEARFILFLRMNPGCQKFLESYMFADGRRREQLERAWRIMQEFQPR